MYEYKIIRTELWWIISRKKEIWRLMVLQYLNWYKLRSPSKWHAKTFYTYASAKNAVDAIKKKD